MKQPRLRIWTRRAGFLAGLAAVAVALLGWRMPPPEGSLGLDLRITANSTGELHVGGAGRPLVAARRLVPGTPHERAGGATELTNQTGSRLAVQVRAVPATRGGDRLIALELLAGGRRVFAGRLGELRSWTERRFEIPPSGTESLEVRAQVPPDVRDRYEGHAEDVTLELRARPLRSAR